MATLDRILVVLLAMVIAAAGAVACIEGVVALLGQDPVIVDPTGWLDAVAGASWTDPAWVTGAVVAALGGLVLLLVQLRRRPPAALSAERGLRGWPVEYDRHGVERLATVTAARHDDVASVAGARATGRRVDVDVVTVRGADTRAVARAVEEDVTTAVGALALDRRLRVHGHARTGDRRVR